MQLLFHIGVERFSCVVLGLEHESHVLYVGVNSFDLYIVFVGCHLDVLFVIVCWL